MMKRAKKSPNPLPRVGVPFLVAIVTLASNASAQSVTEPEKAKEPEASPLATVAPESGASSVAPTSSPELEKLREQLQAQQQRLEAQEAQLTKLQNDVDEAAATSLAANAEAEVDSGQSSRVSLYGYSDMAFKKVYVTEGSRFSGIINEASTFALGNVNLYFDAKPTDEIRALTEVRFTLYPMGSPDKTFSPTDTKIYDSTSATGRNQVMWSGIVLERAHIEWLRYDGFRVLAGYFLTPYGIWNVDHGSPTLISSVLPGFWAGEYFPTRQLGLQVSGEFFKDAWSFGYRAFVSNGRIVNQLDVDKNKHLGGRVFATYAGESAHVTVGASGFGGRNELSTLTPVSVDPFRLSSTVTVAYDEFGAGADASIDWGALRVRSEFVLNHEEYAEGLRPTSSTGAAQRDRTRWDAYLIAAYRLPWAGLEPYLFLEHDRRPTSEDDAATIYSLGLIEHISAASQLKFQGYRVQLENTRGFPNASANSFWGWDLRWVAAF